MTQLKDLYIAKCFDDLQLEYSLPTNIKTRPINQLVLHVLCKILKYLIHLYSL